MALSSSVTSPPSLRHSNQEIKPVEAVTDVIEQFMRVVEGSQYRNQIGGFCSQFRSVLEIGQVVIVVQDLQIRGEACLGPTPDLIEFLGGPIHLALRLLGGRRSQNW